MITGYNTDIDVAGTVFHVQTEDKGLTNPVIETLVYTGGQIVSARKNSYSEMVANGHTEEGQIQQRMEAQHRDVIRELREGTLDKEDLEPFGWNIVSDRSFDQVVRQFVEEEVPLEKLRVELIRPAGLLAGEKTTLTLEVTEETSERPVACASVHVKLVGTDDTETRLFSAVTDDRGRVMAPCEIPGPIDAASTVVCEAQAEGCSVELRWDIETRPDDSIRRP